MIHYNSKLLQFIAIIVIVIAGGCAGLRPFLHPTIAVTFIIITSITITISSITIVIILIIAIGIADVLQRPGGDQQLGQREGGHYYYYYYYYHEY